MTNDIYIQRISNDQLVSDNGKQTVENYLLVDEETPGNDWTVTMANLERELVGWVYDHSDFDEIEKTLVIIFTDLADPEDYTDNSQ